MNGSRSDLSCAPPSIVRLLLLEELGKLGFRKLHHVGGKGSVLLVRLLQVCVVVGAAHILRLEVTRIFVEARAESVVVCLHEHLPVLVHE